MFNRSYFNFVLLFLVCISLPHIIPLGLYFSGYMTANRSVIFFVYCALIILMLYRKNTFYGIIIGTAYVFTVYIDFAIIIKESFFIQFVDVFLYTKKIVDLDIRMNLSYAYTFSAIIVLLIVSYILVALLRRRIGKENSKKYLIISLSCCLAFFIPYYLVQYDEVSNYNSIDPVANNQKIESAIKQSNLIDVTNKNKNYIVVMVEAWGVFEDKNLSNGVISSLYAPDVAEKYVITSGEIPFYGNTTWGEIRELCGIYLNFPDIIEGEKVDCFPEIMSKIGYRTIAYRSFYADLFRFSEWYPLLGFKEIAFGDSLIQYSEGRIKKCDAVFSGACDGDVIHEIERVIKSSTEPVFLYWITVNSHQPVPLKSLVTPRFNCNNSKNIAGNNEVCYTMEIWNELFKEVADVAKNLDNTEILLVGDHIPPFLKRQSREYFSKTHVPWIRLSPK